MSLLPPLLAVFLGATPLATVQLTVERGPGSEVCSDAQALTAHVNARAGRVMIDPQSPELINVAFETLPDGFKARLTRFDGERNQTGSRSLKSVASTCAELSTAVELAIIVAVDPQFATRVPVKPAEAVADAGVPVAPVSRPDAGVAPQPPAFQFLVGVGVVGSLGSSISPTAGPQLLLGLRGQSLEIDLDARVDAPTSVAIETGTVNVGALLVTATGCYRFRWFGFCPAVSAGALRVDGTGFTVDMRQTVPLVLAGGRVFVEWMLAKEFGLRLALAGQTHLIRTTVTVDRVAVWQTPIFAGDFGISVNWNGF